MAFTVQSALTWLAKQGHKTGDARHGPIYARHRAAIIELHFKQKLSGRKIALSLQAGEPLLKKTKLTTITSAICRLLRTERQAREDSATPSNNS